MESGRRVLTRGEHCQLELCGCGVLHLTLGPVTLRVTNEVVRDLLAALRALPPAALGDSLLDHLGSLPARRGDA